MQVLFKQVKTGSTFIYFGNEYIKKNNRSAILNTGGLLQRTFYLQPHAEVTL